MADFFNIHTHQVSSPQNEIVSSNPSYKGLDSKVVYASIGIHPWGLTMMNGQELWELFIREVIANRKVVAIGEVGFDRLKGPAMETQAIIFCREVLMSEDLKLPLIIHCVRAFEVLLRFKKELKPQQPWIIHGFRGKETMAKQLVKKGCYLSIGEHFDESAVRSIPLNRLFVETDSSSRSIELIYQDIAEVKGIPLEELKEAVWKNVDEVFFKR